MMSSVAMDNATTLATADAPIAALDDEEQPNGTASTDLALEHHDWQALIPSILDRRGFACTEQSMDSAKSLLERGLLGNFTQANTSSLLSAQVEESLLESFIEDDYDGALHLTTLDDIDDGSKPVGFVFWRQVPQDEMHEWIHWENLQKKLMGEQQKQKQQQQLEKEEEEAKEQNQDEKGPTNHANRRRMRQSIRMVRDESVRWLEVASRRGSTAMTTTTNPSTTATDLQDTLTHSWVKLELLAVHPDYMGRHLGTLLLACAMYRAHLLGEEHVILHVAGGQANVPALRLYDKFGFLPVPQGTVFHKPDKDLYVLGHANKSLQRLCWPGLLLEG